MVFYLFYEALSIIVFRMVDARLTPDSTEIKLWKQNYSDGGCGTLDMTYSLQNACLNGCAYLTFGVILYICTLNRNNLISYMLKKNPNDYVI